MEANLQLQMKDGKEVVISKKSCELSDLLKGQMTDYPTETKIPIPDVNSKEGEEIKEYLEHCKGKLPKEIPKPLPSNNLKDVLGGPEDEWFLNYINKFKNEELVDLSVAANFMEIQPLLELCAAKFSSMVKDRTEEEIYKIFEITKPFTEEEKQKVREENKWIEGSMP